MDTLMKIDQVPVGKKNWPTQDIVIEEIVIHANPIADQEAGAGGYARFSALFCLMGRSRSRSRDEEGRHRHHRRRSRSGDRHRHRSYERRPRSYGDDERRSRRTEEDGDNRDVVRDGRGLRIWGGRLEWEVD
ncbi:hypothetical protein FOZ63_015180 [Perkinsus olseni]|uniref:Uncharacterized protein n=2 Tax=Perkinsus olseni TaxID=32597 RepID=A0A7J6TJ67_PEROL|nr:hypothetical protein FOZ63_015180 [Perkinsus olseni]